MIKSSDRSGWFGASDTSIIMGSWTTKTFARFWAEKLGLIHNNFTTPQMQAGTHYEHRILETIGIKQMDRQIKIKELRLRINYDGEDDSIIHEVKTYGKKKFVLVKAYWQQVQVEMFGAKKKCQIDAYRLLPEDYKNYFNPIDLKRLKFIPVEYSERWIIHEYLPREKILKDFLIRGEFPRIVPSEFVLRYGGKK